MGVDAAGGATLDETAAELARRARGGDVPTLEALGRARRRLEQALDQIGPILCPERVVLTGILVPLVPWLERTRSRGGSENLPAAVWHLPIHGSRLGHRSVVLGAAEIARLALLDSPLRWDGPAPRSCA